MYRMEDITDLSHYMKWLEEHYSGYTHIYFYAYTLNEDLMVRYKFDHSLRGEFVKTLL